MKLILRRNQEEMKGILGGHHGIRFVLTYRVETSPEEDELIRRYRVENWPLNAAFESDPHKWLKIGDLIKGRTEKLEGELGVQILLKREEQIKDACEQFKLLMEVMKSFGGEEVIEY
jgi:hypothetical protein